MAVHQGGIAAIPGMSKLSDQGVIIMKIIISDSFKDNNSADAIVTDTQFLRIIDLLEAWGVSLEKSFTKRNHPAVSNGKTLDQLEYEYRVHRRAHHP